MAAGPNTGGKALDNKVYSTTGRRVGLLLCIPKLSKAQAASSSYDQTKAFNLQILAADNHSEHTHMNAMCQMNEYRAT
jgi:hypothetical protein